MALLVGLVKTTAARRHKPPHPGASRTRSERMLSATAKSRRPEGAVGAVAATIPAATNEQAIAAQTSEISWRGAPSAEAILTMKMRLKAPQIEKFSAARAWAGAVTWRGRIFKMPELRWPGELETDPLASYMPVAPGRPWRSPLAQL